MTYFECVTILDELITLPLNSPKVEMLSSADISLQGDRYYRFLSQVHYLIKERFNNLEERLTTRFYDKAHRLEEIKLELNELLDEVKYLKSIIKIKHIKKEDYKDFLKKVNDMNNNLVGVLSNMFEGEMIKMTIEEFIIKEESNDEL